MPPGLLGYTYNDDKFAKRQKVLLQLGDDETTNNRNRESQLEDSLKQAFVNNPAQSKLVQWDISEGVKKRANNDDILDYVSEPLKIDS